MSTKLEDLTPATQAAAARALAALKASAVPYVVTYTLRTYAEQAALYAQGRKQLEIVNAMRATAKLPPITEGENNVVTNCDGIRIADGGKGRSPHQLGTALDVVPMVRGGPAWPPTTDSRWAEIAAAFEAEGFEWGGRWTDFPDFPHYQLKG